MTYNQVMSELKTLLESHAMINSVKYGSPINWLFQDDQPIYPLACYDIGRGSLGVGRENIYNVSLWIIDKSGREAEFEVEVVSDTQQILNDIISELRFRQTKYSISDSVSWDAIREKQEDYLSGVQTSFDLTVMGEFGACEFPD